jgi:hypothetical protein
MQQKRERERERERERGRERKREAIAEVAVVLLFPKWGVDEEKLREIYLYIKYVCFKRVC